MLSKFFTSAPTERIVRCYHCRREIIVPGAARTASCPVCFKGLVLDDLRVREGHASGRLSTCGRVVVERKGRAVTRAVEAAQGIEIHGTLEARVVSGGPVQVGTGGQLKGECHATSLVVEPGAVLDRVFVRIGPDAFKAETEANEPKVKAVPANSTLTPHAAPPTLKEIQAQMRAQIRAQQQGTPPAPTQPVSQPVPQPVPQPAARPAPLVVSRASTPAATKAGSTVPHARA